MAVTRFLPVPSDRMGALWNLLALEDACVLEYGPAGTTHYGISLLGELGLSVNGRYFVTHMNESDVVMGDTRNLEEAVLEIDQRKKPAHLFVVGSSVSTTIGTDLTGICHYLQEEVQAKLHVHNSGGFAGDYLVGTEEVYRMLGEIALGWKEKEVSRSLRTPSCNLLGFSPDHFRLESDLVELEDLLKEALDITVASTFVVRGAIRDLDRARQAAVSLVFRKEALPLAQALKEKWGIPYLEVCFYGYDATQSSLKAIGQILGRKLSRSFQEKLEKRKRQVSYFPMYLRKIGKEIHFYSLGPSFLNEGLAAAMSPLGIRFEQQLLPVEEEKSRLRAIQSWKEGMVFADQQTLNLVDSSNYPLLTSFPWFESRIYASHLPFMGLRGMDFLAEQLMTYLLRRGL